MSNTLAICGMGSYHPEGVIDNKFLEDLGIESSAEWIVSKIGILERRTVLPLDYIKETKNEDPNKAIDLIETDSTKMAIFAIEEALKNAGISKDKIGLMICNSCTPQKTLPTEGQRLAKALKFNCPAYDVFTACPAFALHVDYLSKIESNNLPEYVLCVSTAMLTQKVDYKDRSASAIWGDGAAAWVISTKGEGRLKVLETTYDGDPKRCHAVVIDTIGHFHQDGRAVRDFSVRQTVRMIKRLEKNDEIDWNRDIFVGHQANATMLEQIRKNRKIPHENHWSNVKFMGNQAAAGAPAVISEHWEKIEKNQKILVAVVGAGLSWGSVLFEVQ